MSLRAFSSCLCVQARIGLKVSALVSIENGTLNLG